MDFSQVLSVLRLSWDLPWRLLASVLALSTTAGLLLLGVTGLGFLALTSDWLGLDSAVSAGLHDAQDWVMERGAILAVFGTIVLIAGLVFAGAPPRGRHGSRAPATALIGAALAVESGDLAGALVPIACVLGLWLIAAVCRLLLARTSDTYIGDHEVAQAEARIRRTWFSLIVASLYVPAAPISWMIR